MTTFWIPLNVIHVVTGVGACVKTEVEATPAGFVKGRYVAMTPGDIAWDACDCGLLTQSVSLAGPADSFAGITSGTPRNKCGPPLQIVQVTVALIRCVPVMSSTGTPPAPAKLLDSAIIIEYDRYALARGVTCCLAAMQEETPPRVFRYEVGAVNTVGPSGACAGVELTYRFALHNTLGCC